MNVAGNVAKLLRDFGSTVDYFPLVETLVDADYGESSRVYGPAQSIKAFLTKVEETDPRLLSGLAKKGDSVALVRADLLPAVKEYDKIVVSAGVEEYWVRQINRFPLKDNNIALELLLERVVGGAF